MGPTARWMLCLVLATTAAAETTPDFSEAAVATHLAALQPTVLAGFTVQAEPPFVVIGDQEPVEVQRLATGLVRRVSALLRKDFFPKPPDALYDVWLFRDKDSYERNVTVLTGKPPISRYGFCSSVRHALYMNFATGGGTLIHEMTHAFMHGNSPDCPAWINEGLASLMEATTEREGHLYGMVNWRLPLLAVALKAGKAPTFAVLAAMDDDDFYGDDSGAHYGAARYLCYYLQEKGLLRDFVRGYLANQGTDRSGYATLLKVLGNPDMTAFRTEWERFTLALPLPNR